jgi:hypothetical protein
LKEKQYLLGIIVGIGRRYNRLIRLEAGEYYETTIKGSALALSDAQQVSMEQRSRRALK